MTTAKPITKEEQRARRKTKFRKEYLNNWQLYLMLLLPVIWLLVFCYAPMSGIQIAFKDFKIRQGIWGSPWVGFDNFERFFTSYQFFRVLKNTLVISLYSLVASFPLPIVLALSLNVVRKAAYKKFVQMVTYIPHFISVIVIVGMILQMFNSRIGLYGTVYTALTGQPAGRQDGADLTAFRPESFVFYERGGVRFRVDSSFQMDEEAGRLTDPDTGTEYFLEVQTGADQTLALDRLLEPVSQYRIDDAFQGFSFAYPSAEEDLAALSAEDGALYRHNLLTVRFTDGRVIQNAVSLSDGGLLIRVMAVQGGADSEEAVTGMIQYLLTTLKPAETAG